LQLEVVVFSRNCEKLLSARYCSATCFFNFHPIQFCIF